MTQPRIRLLLSGLICLSSVFSVKAADRLWQVGVAEIDITPSYPIRLTGYASRKTESEASLVMMQVRR